MAALAAAGVDCEFWMGEGWERRRREGGANLQSHRRRCVIRDVSCHNVPVESFLFSSVFIILDGSLSF